MIGIAYELAGTGNPDNMALRPYLLDSDGFKEWGREVNNTCAQGVSVVSFHRPYGEKYLGDKFDWSTRRYLVENPDPRFGEYADNFDLLLEHLVTTHPDVRFIVYHGAMVEPDMVLLQKLHENGDETAAAEFGELVYEQIGRHVELARHNPNLWIAFDYSVTYPADSLAWRFVMATRAMLAGRVLIESIPHPDRPHTHKLPAMAGERDYQAKITKDPDRLAVCGEVLRWTQGDEAHDDPKAFVTRAVSAGHTPLVTDTSVKRSGVSVPELVAVGSDAGRPQGVE